MDWQAYLNNKPNTTNKPILPILPILYGHKARLIGYLTIGLFENCLPAGRDNYDFFRSRERRDLRRAALFLCMVFFFAALSSTLNA